MSKAEKIKAYSSLWEELCDLPKNIVGEIFNDELIVSPRPAPKHIAAASSLGDELVGPFQKGKHVLLGDRPISRNFRDFCSSR